MCHMPRSDDPNLANDAVLLRRVLDKPAEWFTHVDGVLRVSSAAFRDSINEVSVNVASETTIEDVLKGNEDNGVVSITTGVPRELKHIVSKTLDPGDPEDPSHRVICPLPEVTSSQIRKMAKSMAIAASWMMLPQSEREATAC